LDALGAGLVPVPWLAVRARVEKGYFVRSLGRDLAARLGTVGHLTALRRTRSGSFTLEEAVPADAPADEMSARLLPLGVAAARVLSVARLSETGVRDARVGRRVRAEDLGSTNSGVTAWVDSKGELVAVGEVSADGAGRVVRGFRQ
jgi:tRNA pseudouridine55 synthase